MARGDRTLVPGLLGYNALPALPNADPAIEDQILIELGGATQFAGSGSPRDASATPFGRFVIPFRDLAALELDIVPVEWWQVSPETRLRIGTLNGSGVELGDLRFGARFSLRDETEHFPALGIRFVTKTTTGKGFENRRFIDAPAYAIDGLLGKDLLGSSTRLRLLVKLGFIAWQQGSDWQDDAFDAGATLQLRTGAARLELEWRGYWGYQQQDKPQLVGITAGWRSGVLEWFTTVNRGLTQDAPPWELRAGVVFRFDSPWRVNPVAAEPSMAPSTAPESP